MSVYSFVTLVCCAEAADHIIRPLVSECLHFSLFSVLFEAFATDVSL